MTNKDPFFSVVIPTYNRAHLIFRAISSVEKQTFNNWELIIADDCSTDNTEQVIRKIGNEKIKFFKNISNKGNAGARNLGIINSSGKYICFLDSDDQYHQNFLEKMFLLINENNYPGFLWCNVNRIDVEGNNVDRSASAKWKPLEHKDPYIFFLKGLSFGTDFGFTVRRDCFQKTGYFDENLRVAVDTDFMLRIVQDFNFNHTTDILVDTYDHEGERVRQKTNEKLNSYQIMYKKHKNTIENNKSLKGSWNYKLMWLSYHNNKKKIAREYFRKSLKNQNKKTLITAALFEIFPVETAINLHKIISKSLK